MHFILPSSKNNKCDRSRNANPSSLEVVNSTYQIIPMCTDYLAIIMESSEAAFFCLNKKTCQVGEMDHVDSPKNSPWTPKITIHHSWKKKGHDFPIHDLIWRDPWISGKTSHVPGGSSRKNLNKNISKPAWLYQGELLKHSSCAKQGTGNGSPALKFTTPNETGRCNKNPPVVIFQSIFLGKLYGRISSKPPGKWSTVPIFAGVFNATSQHLNECNNVPAFHCLAYLLKSLTPKLSGKQRTCSLNPGEHLGLLSSKNHFTIAQVELPEWQGYPRNYFGPSTCGNHSTLHSSCANFSNCSVSFK